MRSLFRKKSLDHIHGEAFNEEGPKLKRTLSALDLTALGIGAIIGTGIFAVIGTAAAGGSHHLGAGPAVSLSFIITAVACGFCALCYAEFAALVPVSGSAYTYSYATLGELVAWIIGWDLVLEYAVGNIAVSIGWAAYFRQLCSGMGFEIPAWLSVDYRSAYQAAMQVADKGGEIPANLKLAYEAWQLHPTVLGIPIIFNVVAAGIVLVITWLLVIGIKESARVNNILVGLKIIILLLFLAVGFFHIKPENWSPFMPNGLQGVWTGASLIFFAFIGFDAVSTAAEECRNPGRDLPIGIIGSLAICTLFYVAIAVVLTGMQPWHQLGVPDPLAAAFTNLGMSWAAGLISLGAVIAIAAVLLVLQMGQTRIFFCMSRDGLLPKGVARVHPKYQTPYITTILTGLAVALIAGISNISEIVELTNIGTLFAFVLVNAGVIILRVTDPDRPRMFRTPFVPVFPLLGIVMCLYLMLGLPAITWKRFIIWLGIGLVVYFTYSRYRSVLARHRRSH
ncbi:MAG TPA: amino acid permease [Candidatus Paceibacterota bacterium]|nr:amino acid permease [Candidatus Paceibacterota bacterium]HSA02598.1 amino acid permease [Candidatus Paceibacterota bacterium]